jgi:fumarate reductase subunit C
MSVRLYLLQRATAALMLPLVLVHLGSIFLASGRGVTAAEILARTRGSVGWGLLYALFVLAAATHGAIGLRVIAAEWTALTDAGAHRLMWGCGIALAASGLCAVAAVVLP